MIGFRTTAKPRLDDQLTPWMADIELSQLQAVLAALGPRTGVEWGAGGSTRWVLEHVPTIERYTSIEHDGQWHGKVAAELDDPRLDLHHVAPNVASPGSTWSNRREQRAILAWRDGCEDDPSWMADYVARPRAAGVADVDFVLVDGRARIYCIAEGFDLLRPGGVLVVHDGQRERYRDTLRALGAVFLEPYRQGQIVVVRKPGADPRGAVLGS